MDNSRQLEDLTNACFPTLDDFIDFEEDSLVLSQLTDKGDSAKTPVVQPNFVTLNSDDMEKLRSEICQIRNALPMLLKQYQRHFMNLNRQKAAAQQEAHHLRSLSEKQALDLKHLRSKEKLQLKDLHKEKQDSISLRNEICELSEITLQQSEFCNSLGTTTCTMLWRVTQKEEHVQSLFGNKGSDAFMLLACDTLESYIASLPVSHCKTKIDEQQQELQFVRSLCGTLTNIAASAYGREEVMKSPNGSKLLNISVSVLNNLVDINDIVTKLRNLVLMFLYNISINQKGFYHLSKHVELYGVLGWTIENDRCVDNRLHAIRLLQSLIIEPSNIEGIHQALEVLPMVKINEMLQKSRGELQTQLSELLQDLQDATSNI